ncbi:MAG: adenylyl-sulfate kinase [Chlorobium sp.]|jgi:adenylylsulfate kinase|nr:adenylyl-sulfate kinase [Chlorobium sp.]
MARSIIGTGPFVEVYLNASLDTCEARDTKGLYRKARAGELPGFTGISFPYETPENPSVTIDTTSLDVEACLKVLIAKFEERF